MHGRSRRAPIDADVVIWHKFGTVCTTGLEATKFTLRPSTVGAAPASSSSRQRRASVPTRLGLTYERSSLARHGLEAFCGRLGGLWASQRYVRVRARTASRAAHEPSPQASGRVCVHAARDGASHDWEGTN